MLYRYIVSLSIFFLKYFIFTHLKFQGSWKYNLHGIGGVHHIPNPCMYSGHFGDNKEKYLEQFDDVIDLNIGKNGLAGFWAGAL